MRVIIISVAVAVILTLRAYAGTTDSSDSSDLSLKCPGRGISEKPGTCDTFYIYSANGEKIEQKCGNGLIFSSRSFKCTQGRCAISGKGKNREKRQTFDPAFKCPKQGPVADPKNCSNFYECQPQGPKGELQVVKYLQCGEDGEFCPDYGDCAFIIFGGCSTECKRV